MEEMIVHQARCGYQPKNESLSVHRAASQAIEGDSAIVRQCSDCGVRLGNERMEEHLQKCDVAKKRGKPQSECPKCHQAVDGKGEG